MFRIDQFKAGDFIDLENYYKEIYELINEKKEDAILSDVVSRFFDILLGGIPKNENDYLNHLTEYQKQLLEIKERFIWIYNPPQTTKSSEEHKTMDNELLNEFAEDYAGYVEIIYLLSNGNYTEIPNVMQMKTVDFMYWGEYAIRKRLIESKNDR